MSTKNLPKILISSCLLGYRVRYDGTCATCDHPLIKQWQDEKRLFPVCPEVLAGFTTPRPSAEIVGSSAKAVWTHEAKVMTAKDQDVTEGFKRAAQQTLQIVRQHNIKVAVLKEGSPSCGVHKIYDGGFNNTKIDGMGVTACFLKQNGVAVFSDQEVDEVATFLEQMTSESKRGES